MTQFPEVLYDYGGDGKPEKTHRQQIAELEAEVERLKAELADWQQGSKHLLGDRGGVTNG